jgi:hypothetical protein
MNQENTIKCLIPQPIIDNMPSSRREEAAGMIVHFFKEANPDLYETLGVLDALSDEIKVECVEKIRTAALVAHRHYLEMINQQ